MISRPARLIVMLATLAAAALMVVAVKRWARPAPLPQVIVKAGQRNLSFADFTVASGVVFAHMPARSADKWMPQVMGSGVAIADFNRDGAPDILLVNSGDMAQSVRAAQASDKLFINDGRGHFSDATLAWGLTSVGYGMGVAVGDYDNDGWPDVFLTSYDGNDRLLKNNGAGFTDVTSQSGIASDGHWSTSAGWADFDNDGDLDLFEERYIAYTPQLDVKTYHNGLHVYSTPILYQPVADRLFLNDGAGHFKDVSSAAGIGTVARKGLGLALGDIDDDGDVDIYVANDTNPNQLWINDGHGRFKDVAQLAGVAYSEAGAEQGSMGADFTDYNEDGLTDIGCSEFQLETTSLYQQERPLLFREVSDGVGIGESARAHLKFGLDFFDADNDGDEDLIVANGHIEDNIAQYHERVTFAQLSSLYENLGNGMFADVSAAAGPALQVALVGRGLATGDLDCDGALDFVINGNGSAPLVARNTTSVRGNFVGLWFEGRRANRSAIGTRIIARVGTKILRRQLMGAESYLSFSDLHVQLGLAESVKIDALTIYWPGSVKQEIGPLRAGNFYHIVEGAQPVQFIPGAAVIAP